MDIKQICEKWIENGCAGECFWEGWPDCPTPEDSLTPEMVLAHISAQDAIINELVEALTERLKLADELALAFCNLQERANGDYEDDNGERAYMVQYQEMWEASESLTAYREASQ